VADTLKLQGQNLKALMSFPLSSKTSTIYLPKSQTATTKKVSNIDTFLF
jgi:hypothetical protein